MPATEAQIAVNRANAALSTGPRTEEGKQASRANALKHGLTGSGVVLPAGQAEEIGRLRESLDRDLRPTDDLGRELVARIATLAVRMGRCAEHESAAVAANVRRAGAEFDEARLRLADRLLDELADSPASATRALKATPEGVDRMIGAYDDLKSDLIGSNREGWGDGHLRRMIHLGGRREGEPGSAVLEGLHRAIRGGDADARSAMVERIDEAVAALREHRATLDLDAIEIERARAGKLALFDPSSEATLARKYEAAAQGGFFRALVEFRRVKAEAETRAQADRAAENRPTRLPARTPELSADRPPSAPAELGSILPIAPPEARATAPAPSKPTCTPSIPQFGTSAPVWAGKMAAGGGR